jgi:hypothetical protein
MATLIRTIWRIDFAINYGLLNNIGNGLKILSEGNEIFWNSAGPGTLPYSTLAEYRSDEIYRRVSLELENINALLEWKGGIELKKLMHTDESLVITKIFNAVLDLGSIKNVKRIGIRFIVLSGTRPASGHPQSSFFAGAELLRSAKRKLGDFSDVALTVEGRHEDKLDYRVTLGPNAKKNIEMHFTSPVAEEAMTPLENHATFFDIDLFETSISLAGNSFAKWASTKIDRASEFIDSVIAEKT